VSKVRWSIVVVAVALVLAVVAWRVTNDDNGNGGNDGDEMAPTATLTDIEVDSSEAYAFPVWGTDGRTPVKLGDVEGQLRLVDPLAARERIAEPRLDVVMPGGAKAHPAAGATLPGSEGGPWVAVATTPKDVDTKDLATTERPLVWTGPKVTSTEDPVRAADPVRLPVDLRSNEVDGATATIDAAVTRLGAKDVAVVAARQRDRTGKLDLASLSVCQLDNCRWRPGAVPQNTAVDAVGSTGSGLVAVTGILSKRAAVWYADDADLTWKRIGSAPRGTTLQTVQDGAGTASLVWMDRDANEIAVQTVRDGKLRNTVPRTEVDGKVSFIPTALEVGGRWYLGGGRPSIAKVSLPYRAGEPVLWELRDKTWVPLDDALLRNQPDQQIEVLFTDPDGDLRAFSSSAVQRIFMTWRFTRGPD
jgi:hypothetical protein